MLMEAVTCVQPQEAALTSVLDIPDCWRLLIAVCLWPSRAKSGPCRRNGTLCAEHCFKDVRSCERSGDSFGP